MNVDRFGYYPPYIPNKFGIVWIVVPSYLLAMVSHSHLSNRLCAIVKYVSARLMMQLFHPTLNNNFFTDTAWAFSLYLEAVAIMPQLYLFQKKVRYSF